MILRCFVSRNKDLLYKAFVSYVRPILEYCSNVWSPYKLKEIRKVEAVQRRFTKKIFGLSNLSYAKRLKLLKSETLEARRVRSDLCVYYKVLNNMIEPNMIRFFNIRKCRTRNNGCNLKCNRCKTKIEQNLFRNRHINV